MSWEASFRQMGSFLSTGWVDPFGEEVVNGKHGYELADLEGTVAVLDHSQIGRRAVHSTQCCELTLTCLHVVTYMRIYILKFECHAVIISAAI